MRVLLVSRRYYPDVKGGGQISAHHIAQSLVEAGHAVRVCTFVTEGHRRDEVLDGVHVTSLPIRTIPFFPRLSNLEWMYSEMRRTADPVVREFRPDVLHSLNGESAPAVASLSKKYGIPYVITVNGPTLLCFPGEGIDSKGRNCLGCRGWQRFRETMLTWGKGGPLRKTRAFLYWLYSYPHMAVFNRALRSADMLLPGSVDFKRRLRDIGFRDERLRVVYNPISSQQRVRSSVRHDFHIPAGQGILLYAGRIAYNKGIDAVIRALPGLPRAHFIIAGRGVFADACRRLAAEIGVQDRVHFVGYMDNSELSRYYSAADIVLMAGTFYENFSRMLLEASAYGKPIIAPAIGGNLDIIEHGRNGYLLHTREPAEIVGYVKDILDHPAKARAMGEYARRKVRSEFSHERTAEALACVYEEVLARRARRNKRPVRTEGVDNHQAQLH